MRIRGRRLAVALTFVAFASGALAAAPAAKVAPPTPAPTEQPPAPPAEPPPYEPQLLRMAEVIGALSYLRDLCGEGDGSAFRAKFATLLETEGNTPARKETLAGAFNRGLHDYELTYRTCTPTAREIIASFLDEAARTARDLANRYGG